MRFILVSADDPNLRRPLDIPDELVKTPHKPAKSKAVKRSPIIVTEKEAENSVPTSPQTSIKIPTPEIREQSKRTKTHQKSRIYG